MTCKSILLKISAVILIVLIVDFSIGRYSTYIKTHTFDPNNKIEYVRCACTDDILLMGSSRCNFNYNPKIIEENTGLTCYNCGLNGQGIITAYAIYELMRTRHKPQMIIYELWPDNDLNEAAFDNKCAYYLNTLKEYYDNTEVARIIKNISPLEYYKMYSNLYRNNMSLPNPKRLVKSNPIPAKTYKGFTIKETNQLYDENAEVKHGGV